MRFDDLSYNARNVFRECLKDINGGVREYVPII